MTSVNLENMTPEELSLFYKADQTGLMDDVKDQMIQQAKSNSLVQNTAYYPTNYQSGTYQSDVIVEQNNTYTINIDGTQQDINMEESGYFLTLDFTEIVDAVQQRCYDDYKNNKDKLAKDFPDYTQFLQTTAGTLDKREIFGGPGYLNSSITGGFPASLTENFRLNGQSYHMCVANNMNALAFKKKNLNIGTNSVALDDKNYAVIRVEDTLKRAGVINTGRTAADIMNDINPLYFSGNGANVGMTAYPKNKKDFYVVYGGSQAINNLVTQEGTFFKRLHIEQNKLTMWVPLQYELDSIQADNLMARVPITLTLSPATYGEIIRYATFNTDSYIVESDVNSTWGENQYSANNKIWKANLVDDLDVDKLHELSLFKSDEFMALLKKNIKMQIVTKIRYRNPTLATLTAQNDQLTSGVNETYTYRPRSVNVLTTQPIVGQGEYTFGPTGQIGVGGINTVIADYMILYPHFSDTPSITQGSWVYNNVTDLNKYYRSINKTTGLPLKFAHVPSPTTGAVDTPYNGIDSVVMNITDTPGGSGPSQNRQEYKRPDQSFGALEYGWGYENMIPWLNLMYSGSIPGTRVDGFINKRQNTFKELGSLLNLNSYMLFSLQPDGSYSTFGGDISAKIRVPSGVSFKIQKNNSSSISFTIIHLSTASVSVTDQGAVLVNNSTETL